MAQENLEFAASFSYAPTDSEDMKPMWSRFKTLAEFISLSWITIGDLNVIGVSWEKSGGMSVFPAKTQELQTFFTEVSMVEVSFTGNPFTWHNRRYNSAFVKERIDIIIVNLEWMQNSLIRWYYMKHLGVLTTAL